MAACTCLSLYCLKNKVQVGKWDQWKVTPDQSWAGPTLFVFSAWEVWQSDQPKLSHQHAQTRHQVHYNLSSGGLFGHTRQSKSMTKSILNKFFWAKEKCWKTISVFYYLCVRCTINSTLELWYERRVRKTIFKLGLDQLEAPSQKSIFKAVFWG